MTSKTVFGPAGNPQEFYDRSSRPSDEMPAWLAAQNLGAYEYQCGRGVNIGREKAALLGLEAHKHQIRLSVHAPYYINLATTEEDKKNKTADYILDSLRAARAMSASRVVLHPGSAKHAAGREGALALAVQLLTTIIRQADEEALLVNCTLCPEVMGKINQLGDLDEVLALCRLDDRLLPCVDFGHLNARMHGGLQHEADYRRILQAISRGLGAERMRRMHIHFSRIEFTAGGEKKHHRLRDTQYGPDFEPLAQVMAEQDMSAVVICESMESQAADALILQQQYLAACGRNPVGTCGEGPDSIK